MHVTVHWPLQSWELSGTSEQTILTENKSLHAYLHVLGSKKLVYTIDVRVSADEMTLIKVKYSPCRPEHTRTPTNLRHTHTIDELSNYSLERVISSGRKAQVHCLTHFSIVHHTPRIAPIYRLIKWGLRKNITIRTFQSTIIDSHIPIPLTTDSIAIGKEFLKAGSRIDHKNVCCCPAYYLI